MNSTPKIESVLDVGGGRGYLSRILQSNDIKSTCMDISKHCQQTRVTDDFVLHDATKTPWPFKDKEFDLVFSINFLEHIPEDKLDDVIKEMDRVSNRGMHGIHFDKSPFEEQDEDIDITHATIQSKEWWENKFKTVAPNHRVVIEHPRMLEYEQPEHQPPISRSPGQYSDEKGNIFPNDSLLKLNIGSFKDMFYFGWLNMDIIDLTEFSKTQAYRFMQHDITKGLPFKDNEVDIIFHSHILEHLTREEGKKFMQECYRVMKPEAVIRVSVPDTKIITQKYLNGKISDYKYINTGVETCEDDADAYHNLLMENHKTIYDDDSIKKLLEKIGFKNIETTTPFKSRNDTIQTQTVNPHPNLSIVVEAEK